MIDQDQISTNQFVWLLFLIITSVTVLQAPGILMQTGSRDAWMSVVGGIILDVLLAIAYAYMGLRFPKENFVQYSRTILGRWIGTVVGLMFPFLFLLTSVLVMRSFSMIIHTAFLPKTPLPVISISGYAVIAYGARKGIEVIARVSEILGPIYFISVIIISLILLPSADIQRIKPILENGFLPVIKGSFYIVTNYGICIMMAMFIPICNQPKNGFFAKFTAVNLGGFLVGIVVIFSIMVFGFQQGVNKIAPSLSLLRVASLGTFFERFEIMWMLIAVGAAIIASAQLIWAVSVGISQTFGMNQYKPVVLSVCLFSVVLGETSFHNQGLHSEFLQFTAPIIAFFIETILEIFLLIMALILKKGEKGHFKDIKLWPAQGQSKS